MPLACALSLLPATLTTTARCRDAQDTLPARMDRHQGTVMVITVLHQVIGIEGLCPATGVLRLVIEARVGEGLVAAVKIWNGVTGSKAATETDCCNNNILSSIPPLKLIPPLKKTPSLLLRISSTKYLIHINRVPTVKTTISSNKETTKKKCLPRQAVTGGAAAGMETQQTLNGTLKIPPALRPISNHCRMSQVV